jgi:hypothetical protein
MITLRITLTSLVVVRISTLASFQQEPRDRNT